MTVELYVSGWLCYLSDEDSDLLNRKWFRNSHGYAIAERTLTAMHRQIMERMIGREIAANECVDHINGDTLDNRRDNLRLATSALNQFNRGLPAHNTTGAKGVYRNSAGNLRPWQAAITINRRKRYLGSYATFEEAARAYNRAAANHAGPYARLNQPFDRGKGQTQS